MATLLRKGAEHAQVEGDSAAEQGSRFGIIATKRVGNAVMRNALRRRMREVLRQHAEPLGQGLYVVLIMRHRAAEATYAQLEREFTKLLPRVTRALSKNQNKLPTTC